jgi:hypothetical protein
VFAQGAAIGKAAPVGEQRKIDGHHREPIEVIRDGDGGLVAAEPYADRAALAQGLALGLPVGQRYNHRAGGQPGGGHLAQQLPAVQLHAALLDQQALGIVDGCDRLIRI